MYLISKLHIYHSDCTNRIPVHYVKKLVFIILFCDSVFYANCKTIQIKQLLQLPDDLNGAHFLMLIIVVNETCYVTVVVVVVLFVSIHARYVRRHTWVLMGPDSSQARL